MTGYYLLEHPNPNCIDRGDGQYHGYMQMQAQPALITVHTTESFADLIAPDTGAEAVANYFATTATPASYHTIVDSDSTVDCLPAGLDGTTPHTAFHCWNRNTGNLGISFAMRATEWQTVTEEWKTSALNRAADTVAAWCRRWDIPARKITLAEADAGMAGISGHGILQPEDRTDPGAATVFAPSLFPWDRFLGMVNERLDGGEDKDKDMPALLCNIDGSIYGCFADGVWRMLGGAEYTHWSAKGVDQVAYTKDEWATLRGWGRVA